MDAANWLIINARAPHRFTTRQKFVFDSAEVCPRKSVAGKLHAMNMNSDDDDDGDSEKSEEEEEGGEDDDEEEVLVLNEDGSEEEKVEQEVDAVVEVEVEVEEDEEEEEDDDVEVDAEEQQMEVPHSSETTQTVAPVATPAVTAEATAPTECMAAADEKSPVVDAAPGTSKLKARSKAKRWSSAEDARLMAIMQAKTLSNRAGLWRDAAEELGTGRSQSSVEQHWYYMQRKTGKAVEGATKEETVRPSWRRCGVFGCTLPDYHRGLHRVDVPAQANGDGSEPWRLRSCRPGAAAQRLGQHTASPSSPTATVANADSADGQQRQRVVGEKRKGSLLDAVPPPPPPAPTGAPAAAAAGMTSSCTVLALVAKERTAEETEASEAAPPVAEPPLQTMMAELRQQLGLDETKKLQDAELAAEALGFVPNPSLNMGRRIRALWRALL